MDISKILARYLNPNIRQALLSTDIVNTAEEIRIRQNKPLTIIKQGNIYYCSKNGMCNVEKAFRPPQADILDTLSRMCEYSPYAYNDEIRRGFITLEGGFRVGVAGTIVENKDIITTIKYINSMNIRISKEIIGCANRVMNFVNGNVLIVSPPGCGKTTLLRDVIRQLSLKGKNISVVDERCEISGAYLGNIQFDLGNSTDVMACCSKALGMNMMLRAMAPDIIAVDEIGSKEDIEAIHNILNSGVNIIATLHCDCFENMASKPIISKLIDERLFDNYIFLNNKNGIGNIAEIYDKELNQRWQ